MENKARAGQLEALIQETIAALTILDAVDLTRLRQDVDSLAVIGVAPDEDLVAAMLAHRLLGELLRETDRNLRVLHATSPCVGLMGAGAYGTFSRPSELTRG